VTSARVAVTILAPNFSRQAAIDDGVFKVDNCRCRDDRLGQTAGHDYQSMSPDQILKALPILGIVPQLVTGRCPRSLSMRSSTMIDARSIN
jgi:hypothetical protein